MNKYHIFAIENSEVFQKYLECESPEAASPVTGLFLLWKNL